MVLADTADVDGRIPLIEAIMARHTEVANLLWEKGARLAAGDIGKCLCTVARDGNVEVLQEFLKYEADVNEVDSEGLTALHLAAVEGHTSVVKVLLSEGANVTKADNRGLTPLEIAQELNDHEIVGLLRAARETTSLENSSKSGKKSPKDLNRRGSSSPRLELQVLNRPTIVFQ